MSVCAGITAIPRCLFEYEKKKEKNSWNFPAHPNLVPYEELPLKSSWQKSLLKTRIIHWDRGMTGSKSDSEKCKKGGN